jgi:hypothetical protein
MPDLSAIQTTGAALRSAFDATHARLNAVDAALAANAAQQAAATRTGGADVAALAADAQRLAQERASLAAQRAAAAANLHDTIGGLLGQLDPAGALQALDASTPVALLPVRLETRFNPANAAELLVRILPDDIHGDSHEPELTANEVTAGQRFWTTVWNGPTAEPDATNAELAAWTDLTGRVGMNRAAWIVRQTSPANLATRPAGAPTFPAPTLKGDTWTRAAWTTALPDRWVVLAYRGGQRIATAWGSPVPDHVHMGPDPAAVPPSVSSDGTPRVDAGLQWVIDFAAAEQAGLGVRVPVPAQGGLDRVIAFGVRGSLAPADGAARLAGLFDAHHFTRGMSIVPQGTPTNNTPSARAGWSARPSAATTFANERRPGAQQPKSTGTLLAQALGVDPATFATVANATADEQSGAASMAALLFGATLGYYLDELLQGFDVATPGPSPQNTAAVRRHFIDYVRARGPLPVVRVGNQPYGVLPVTSLQRWQPFDEDPTVRNLPTVLRAIQLFWRAGAAAAPHLGGSADIDGDFVHALTLDARSTSLNVRTAQSATFCRTTEGLLGAGQVDPCGAAQEIAATTWAALSLTGGLLGHEFESRLGEMVLGKEAPALRLPLVAGSVDPHTYLELLRTSTLEQISSDAVHVSSATSVLATLARHAVLLAYGAAADELGRRSLTPAATGPLRATLQAEIYGVAATATASSRFSAATKAAPLQALFTPIAGVTNNVNAGDYLRTSFTAVSVDPIRIEINRGLLEIDAALADLAQRPADELDALLMETLDAVSHRFDAWVTSFATRRLGSLRARAPGGVSIGGYGWVENLVRAAPDPLVDPPAGETAPLWADVRGGGFIHAPTLNQAAAAGVLRSAHLSHAGTAADGALAIDLSSRRVCLAMELLDGVRAGQPLGALLGYRLERNLHDGFAPLELDRYIAPLRRIAPLVANSVTAPVDGEPVEAIAARNVVDGLALSRLAPADVRAKLAADPALAAPPANELDTVMSALAAMTDAVDALGDLMLAESVYQVVQGNTARIGMTVDAINRGAVLPEPDVARTHRSGSALAHRVLVLLPAANSAPAAGWQRVGPRAQAETRLDAWAGRLLGDPGRVRIRATFTTDAANSTTIDVSLADIIGGLNGLAAIDVLYDSNANGASISALETRLAQRLALAPPAGAPASFAAISLGRGRDPGWTSDVVAFDEFVTFAAALRALAVGARAANGADLGRPEDAPAAGVDTADLAARADAAQAAFTAATAAAAALLAPTPSSDTAAVLRANDALAAFGLLPAGSGPAAVDLVTALAHASALTAAASARAAKVAKLRANPRPAADPLGDYDSALLAELFGADFRPLPVIAPANAPLLTQAAAASTALQGGDSAQAWRWLRRTATVRAPAARLCEAMLFANVLGTGGDGDLRVAQIPFIAGATWIGLPGAPPAAPTTGLVAHMPAGIDFAGGVCGLFIDEWSEVVPLDSQTTGISFAASTPGARAPQSILLVVSPDPSKPWDLETFEAILNETFELAQQRTVDLDTLPWLGHFLPATYIADSALDTTIGVHFKDVILQANLAFQAFLKASQP